MALTIDDLPDNDAFLDEVEQLNRALVNIEIKMAFIQHEIDNHHTCALNHLRHPWPLDKQCHACINDLMSYIKRYHWEIPFALFGWDTIIEMVCLQLELHKQRREAISNIGAFI